MLMRAQTSQILGFIRVGAERQIKGYGLNFVLRWGGGSENDLLVNELDNFYVGIVRSCFFYHGISASNAQ